MYAPKLVPLAGIGPATSPLPRECSTTEPQGRKHLTNSTGSMERETGIEPVSLAWKAKVLPLNYSRTDCTARVDAMPMLGTISNCSIKPTFASLLVEETGFEPV